MILFFDMLEDRDPGIHRGATQINQLTQVFRTILLLLLLLGECVIFSLRSCVVFDDDLDQEVSQDLIDRGLNQQDELALIVFHLRDVVQFASIGDFPGHLDDVIVVVEGRSER